MGKKALDVRQANELASAYDKSLLADDARFDNSVKIVDCEGTVLSISSAFLVKNGKWLLCFAEHHSPQVFHMDEIVFWCQ
jgi:hypothetical protein